VLDQHNAVFMVLERMARNVRNPLVRAWLGREVSKLEAFEREACERFDRVVWVSDADRRAVTANGGGRNGQDQVIPIAIDPQASRTVVRARPFRVTFIAGMHWPPNADGISWFASSVWPKVAAAAPSAVLTVIGKRPPRSVAALGRSSNVETLGYVRDLHERLSETAVFIVPLRSGAGMRVKILDAWCWGIPVVSTTVGAEGLASAHGENILIADDEQSFADAVLQVLGSHRVASRLAEGGRSTAETSYDWRSVYRAWDQIYH
jgi:glycosyltransferase involved in cell wall biosynthesis